MKTNPRVPMETLSDDEASRLRSLVREVGEAKALALVGLRDAAAFYKAAGGFPVARLTAEVIRGRLASAGSSGRI